MKFQQHRYIYLIMILLFFTQCDKERKAGDGEVHNEDHNFSEQKQELSNEIRSEIVNLDNAIDYYQTNLNGMSDGFKEEYADVIDNLREQEKTLQELLNKVTDADQGEWEEVRNEVKATVDDIETDVTNLKQEITTELSQ